MGVELFKVYRRSHCLEEFLVQGQVKGPGFAKFPVLVRIRVGTEKCKLASNFAKNTQKTISVEWFPGRF